MRDLEAKSRRRDILVDEERIYEFYDQRIPEGIFNTPEFEKWLRADLEAAAQAALSAGVRPDAGGGAERSRPSSSRINLCIGGMRLPLEYHFDPGQQADGVTLVVPRSVLNQVTEERLQWLVPGLLRERVIGLLRGLPKSLRRSFVPVPDYADACLKGLEASDRPLVQVLGERLKQLTGVHVPEDAWNEQELPEHLRMQVRVVDEQGNTLGASRRLAEVKRLAEKQGQSRPHQLATTRHGADWPQTVGLRQPAAQRQGASRVASSWWASRPWWTKGIVWRCGCWIPSLRHERRHKAGVRRLIMLKLNKDIRYLRRNLPNLERMRLQYAKVPDAPKGLRVEQRRSLEDELVFHIVDQTFLDGEPEIRDEQSFQSRVAEQERPVDSRRQPGLRPGDRYHEPLPAGAKTPGGDHPDQLARLHPGHATAARSADLSGFSAADSGGEAHRAAPLSAGPAAAAG